MVAEKFSYCNSYRLIILWFKGELSLLRNKLTVFESRNQALEQEKSDLTETVNMLRGSTKSEPGELIDKVC